MKSLSALIIFLTASAAFAAAPPNGAPTVNVKVQTGYKKCVTMGNGSPTCSTQMADSVVVPMALVCIDGSITPYVECNSAQWNGTITADDQTFSPNIQLFLNGAGGTTPDTDPGSYSFGAGIFGTNVNYSMGHTFDFAKLVLKGSSSMSVSRDNGETDTYLPIFIIGND